MSSDASFVEFVVGQARGAGHIESRRMFGEDAVYCDGKVVMLVCDNRCVLKPTDATLDRVRDCPPEPPYPGAKLQPVVDELLDDANLIPSRADRYARDGVQRRKSPAEKLVAFAFNTPLHV